MEFGRKKVIDISDMLYEFDSPFTFGPFWLLNCYLSGEVHASIFVFLQIRKCPCYEDMPSLID